jgi:hypothetical protein
MHIINVITNDILYLFDIESCVNNGGSMERLYIETEHGNLPIETEIAEKYNLQKGDKSPFTGQRIVDRYGDATAPKPPEEEHDLSNHEDEIEDLENGFQISTSEMLDIAAGVDSSQR